MSDETPALRDIAESSPLIKYDDISKALDSAAFTGVGALSFEYLFVQVGQSLATFEKVQDEIVALFDLLCGGSFEGISPMGRIIGATSSFNVKMDLTKQAAKSFLSNYKQQSAVLKWLKLAQKASLIRNKIAHGQPVRAHFVANGESMNGAFWAPSLRDTNKVNWPESRINEWRYAWNAVQLNEYNKAFHDLYAMLLTLRENLAGLGDESTVDVLDPTRM